MASTVKSVSRSSSELHFVCQGTASPVAVGDLDTFNLLKYLPSADPLSTSWAFPPTCDLPLTASPQALASGSRESGLQHECEVPAGESVSRHDDQPTAGRCKLSAGESVPRHGDQPMTGKRDLSEGEAASGNSVGGDLSEAPVSNAPHTTKSRFGRPIRRPKRFDS